MVIKIKRIWIIRKEIIKKIKNPWIVKLVIGVNGHSVPLLVAVAEKLVLARL
jgi:hypothetical protein